MIATATPTETASSFLNMLYGDAPGWLLVWTPKPATSYWFPGHDLAGAAEQSAQLSRSSNTYFGVGLRREALGKTARGGDDDVIAIPGLWVDLDVLGPAHKAENLPPTIEDALSLLREYPMKPSAIVATGHGLQVWWLFDELWAFRDDGERQRAKDLSRRFQATLRGLADRHGWTLDGTHDLSRVLRLPGTQNRKPELEPVEVRLLGVDTTRRYKPEDFEPHILDISHQPGQNGYGPVELPDTLPQVDVGALGVPPWVKRLIVEGRDADPERYPSRSEAQFAVLGALINASCDDAAIASVLLDPANAIGQKARTKGVLWVKGEIGRARAKASMVEMASAEDVPPFPMETLPPAFAALVAEAATAVVVPPEFIAVPLLAAAGAAIGNTLELELKPGWREGANLYAAIVGDPGSKKSPALKVAVGSTHRRQERLAKEFDSEYGHYVEELADWDATPKDQRGVKPEPPVFDHVYSSDATTEALAERLAASKGLIMEMDELTGWVKSMDQYHGGGKGADRQFFLKAWSRVSIKVDRKGQLRPITVFHPSLAVVGGVQPDLLPVLADAAMRNDGFLDRLLWAYPEPIPDHWEPLGIHPETEQAVDGIFERLFRLQGGTPAADADNEDENGQPEARVVVLSPLAMTLWIEWYGEHTAEAEAETLSHQLRGPWAKMPGQAARLALILHAFRAAEANQDPTSKPVSAEALGAALDLVDYFKGQARKVYRQLAREHQNMATTILAALKEQGEMMQSQLLRDVFKRNVRAEQLRAELEDLKELGLVTSEERRESGRPPATVWKAA